MGLAPIVAGARFRVIQGTIIAIVCAGVLAGGVSDARAGQSSSGVINGRVVRQDGSPLAGVMAVLQSTGAVEFTGVDGRYRFTRVPVGAQSVLLTLGPYSSIESIEVRPGPAADTHETAVDWPLSFVETMVVVAPSRQVESIAQAPAAVTVLTARDLERQAGQAQLPQVVASAPGVQVAQAGLYDYSLNTRGFNDMVNRRVRVEIDGRDTSQPHVMGNTDWASVGQALDEFEQVEMVRGPAGALYGLGALNGMLSLRSKDPAESLGGKGRFTFGELAMARVDARHAASLGNGWFFKGLGGYQRSGGFAVSRVDGVEYAPGQLPLEAAPLATDTATVAYGSARADKHFAGGEVLTLEGGTSYKDGAVTVTGLGRYQADGATFPWASAGYRARRWRALAAVTAAKIVDQLSLGTGTTTFQRGYNLQLELHSNRAFSAGRGRVVGGVSYGRQRVDSANEQGVQTIFDQPESSNAGAIFGQADYDIARKLTASLALRVDATSLTRTTLSPRAAAIYELAANHRVRLAYGDAFKAPTLAETRLRAPVAPPLDLSAIEAALAPVLGGASLGFESIPLLVVGNEHLEVEEVKTIEAGYSGVFRNTLVQATYYRNLTGPFTSGLLPQVGTSLGRLNPDFGPYQPPAGVGPLGTAAINAALSAAIPGLAPSLSNLSDGRPVFALLSLTNFGEATTQGLELGAMTVLPSGWQVDANYAWFQLVRDEHAAETPIYPNTPTHQASAGVAYGSARFDAGARVRWVDQVDWRSGIYAGLVPSYAIVDLRANVPLTPRLAVGLDVSNLLDNSHYEVFGGDLLGRRALGHLTVDW